MAAPMCMQEQGLKVFFEVVLSTSAGFTHNRKQHGNVVA